MSEHWQPPQNIAARHPNRARREWTRAQHYWSEATRHPLPEGAKVGLFLIGAASVGVAIAAYQLLGPRDVITKDASIDWDAIEGGDPSPR
jgi:hypothetical protein